MEKSIETIWKEGFLKSDALIAPKLNDLYNQKSKHIIDKFKRMFKINLIAFVFFAFAMLAVTFFNGLPIIGISWFLILIALVVVNKKLTNSLEKIDYHKNSYEYLKSFNKWLQEQLALNKKMARLYYPLFFLSIIVGCCFRRKTSWRSSLWFSGYIYGVWNSLNRYCISAFYSRFVDVIWRENLQF